MCDKAQHNGSSSQADYSKPMCRVTTAEAEVHGKMELRDLVNFVPENFGPRTKNPIHELIKIELNISIN